MKFKFYHFTLLFAFSILNISVVAAQDISQTKQTQSHPLSYITHQTEQLQNNFTSSGASSGNDMCKKAFMNQDCWVVQNTSKDELEVKWLEFPEGHYYWLPPKIGAVLLATSYKQTPKTTRFSVINTVTNVEIFNGDVKDMVGLICDETSCRDWN
ncbi:MAG: hypothetical protein ACPGUD_05510 [Parashewanella sp.]